MWTRPAGGMRKPYHSTVTAADRARELRAPNPSWMRWHGGLVGEHAQTYLGTCAGTPPASLRSEQIAETTGAAGLNRLGRPPGLNVGGARAAGTRGGGTCVVLRPMLCRGWGWENATARINPHNGWNFCMVGNAGAARDRHLRTGCQGRTLISVLHKEEKFSEQLWLRGRPSKPWAHF